MDETVKFLDTMREILAKESIDQSKQIFIGLLFRICFNIQFLFVLNKHRSFIPGKNKKTQNSIKISLSSKDFDHKLNEWKYVYLMSQTKNHVNSIESINLKYQTQFLIYIIFQIKYENDSKEILKETEAIIQSLASDEASDICLRINDSIKVKEDYLNIF